MYVGRYAPSPTGDLHLGNVLACLVAWVRARQRSGKLILRMEDLDTPRVIDGAAARIEADLAWLGFDFDKHPHDDDHAFTQSTRGEDYLLALEKLQDAGRLFACRCSRRDIAEAASAPHGPSGVVYPGTCKDLGLPFDTPDVAWRFQPEPGEVVVDDAWCGPYAQDVERDVGAFVVHRKDGIVAYHLAVVVDDAEQGVTEVVRGRDLLDSSPRQVQLYRALGFEPPAFAHGPLLVDDDGRRLAKRDGDQTLGALRDRGVIPEVILGWLGEALGATQGPASLDELREAITDEHVKQESVRLPFRA
jgi:glutamyl-tRNA synthetase